MKRFVKILWLVKIAMDFNGEEKIQARQACALLKFWLLIKIAHLKLMKVRVVRVLCSVYKEQENLKTLLTRIIDGISLFFGNIKNDDLSHSANLREISKNFSEDLIDLAIGLRSTYLFPAYDNVLYYASDLNTLVKREFQRE